MIVQKMPWQDQTERETGWQTAATFAKNWNVLFFILLTRVKIAEQKQNRQIRLHDPGWDRAWWIEKEGSLEGTLPVGQSFSKPPIIPEKYPGVLIIAVELLAQVSYGWPGHENHDQSIAYSDEQS